MTSNQYLKRNSWILGVAIALAATSVCAATSVVQAAAAQIPVNRVASSSTETTAEASRMGAPRGDALGAGVRKAAMQGPEELRRYIWRTRMIYNYYFWDFVKEE